MAISTIERGERTVEPILITVKEAEALLSLPATGAYKYIADWERKGMVVRLGRRSIRINRQKLIEWANGRAA